MFHWTGARWCWGPALRVLLDLLQVQKSTVGPREVVQQDSGAIVNGSHLNKVRPDVVLGMIGCLLEMRLFQLASLAQSGGSGR
jgi:hypothetical protein